MVAAADIEAAALDAVAAEDLVAIDEEAVAMEAVVVAEEADLEVDAAAAVVATTATRKDISLANALRWIWYIKDYVTRSLHTFEIRIGNQL